MSIKKFRATKDNTITNSYRPNLRQRGTLSNMGASDVAEVFSIYGQQSSSSIEKTRALYQFSTKDIKDARDLGQIKEKDSVSFFLRLFNAPHNTTTPHSFTMSVCPLLESWNEGRGLDMETYLDLGASNWISSSKDTPWSFEGGTYSELVSSRLTDPSSAQTYTQYFNTGKEDLQIDITTLVESWLVNQEGASVKASGQVTLAAAPSNDKTQKITLYSYSGDYRDFVFSTSSATSGNTIFVSASATGSATDARNELLTQISSTSLFTAASDGTNAINVTQSVAGIYGNTIISVSGSEQITKQNFSGGTGVQNRGLIVKLSGSAESGEDEKTYYTKRFFTRNSQYFFKKPVIESRSEKIIEDDRGCVVVSSSLKTADDNLNKIYFYNLSSDGDYIDIPNTGSNLVVNFVSSIGGDSVSISGTSVNDEGTHATASREQEGIYSVKFAYAGSETKLYDIWSTQDGDTITNILTGSGFDIDKRLFPNDNVKKDFKFKITNLKNSYTKDETVTFRVHTVKKGITPTVYTKASSNTEVTNIKELYYKVSRVTDNYTVIPYTEDSSIKYSKLSYDMNGSFFELDMSLFAPNYLYEISFLRKSGKNYIEQGETFKFRIEK